MEMSDTVFSADAMCAWTVITLSMLTRSGSLFDMDGTLVDSTAGVVGAWETFRESYPDIDINKILKC